MAIPTPLFYSHTLYPTLLALPAHSIRGRHPNSTPILVAKRRLSAIDKRPSASECYTYM